MMFWTSCCLGFTYCSVRGSEVIQFSPGYMLNQRESWEPGSQDSCCTFPIVSSCRKSRAHSEQSLGNVMPGYRQGSDPSSYVIGYQSIESKYRPTQHYLLSKMMRAQVAGPLCTDHVLSAFLLLFIVSYETPQRKFSFHFNIHFILFFICFFNIHLTACISFCKFSSAVFCSKLLQIVSACRFQGT